MSKYSYQFKLEVVEYSINQKISSYATAKHFGINREVVREWMKKYEKHGVEGLLKQKSSSYNGDFKVYVVEYMHNNHLSLVETAIQFRLSNHKVVGKWEKIYCEEGPQALYEKRRGKVKNMSLKKEKNKNPKETEETLEEEVERLRMENEYLKKLNALVQERIQRENKKK